MVNVDKTMKSLLQKVIHALCEIYDKAEGVTEEEATLFTIGLGMLEVLRSEKLEDLK